MKSRNKDHKTHESIIGKIIYGFLLFMPLLAIGVTCAYAIFNKNAYKSYSGSDEIREFTDINGKLEINNEYYFNTDGQTNTANYELVTTYTNSIVVYNNQELIRENKLISFQLFYTTAPRLRISYYDENEQIVTAYWAYTPTQVASFTFSVGANYTINSIYDNYIKKIETNVEQKIDNVFYYSIDKVQQSPLFNWAEDSAIYTGMTATCTTLNITTPFIPLLMTYWLIISVIYILYDIILVILHIFHNKIHQLEDSF